MDMDHATVCGTLCTEPCAASLGGLDARPEEPTMGRATASTSFDGYADIKGLNFPACCTNLHKNTSMFISRVLTGYLKVLSQSELALFARTDS